MLAMIPNTRFRPSSILFTIRPELVSLGQPAAACRSCGLAAPFDDQILP